MKMIFLRKKDRYSGESAGYLLRSPACLMPRQYRWGPGVPYGTKAYYMQDNRSILDKPWETKALNSGWKKRDAFIFLPLIPAWGNQAPRLGIFGDMIINVTSSLLRGLRNKASHGST
jgi:hypothetical protein